MTDRDDPRDAPVSVAADPAPALPAAPADPAPPGPVLPFASPNAERSRPAPARDLEPFGDEEPDPLADAQFRDPSTWPQSGEAWVYEGRDYQGRFPCPVDPEELKRELGGGKYVLLFKGAKGRIVDKARFPIGGPNVRAAARHAIEGAAGSGERKGAAAQLLEALQARHQAPAPSPAQPAMDPALLKILEQQTSMMQMILAQVARPQEAPASKLTDQLLAYVLTQDKPKGDDIDRLVRLKEAMDKMGGGAGDLAQLAPILGMASNFFKQDQPRQPAQQQPQPQQAEPRQLPAPAAPQAAGGAAPQQAAAGPASASGAPESAKERAERITRYKYAVSGNELAEAAVASYANDDARNEALAHCAILMSRLTPRSDAEQLRPLPQEARVAIIIGALADGFPDLAPELGKPHARAFVGDVLELLLSQGEPTAPPDAASAEPAGQLDADPLGVGERVPAPA